jgi:hypothetical protein
MPTAEEILSAAQEFVDTHGLVWVRDGITKGQYRHADGLHFGGDRTEQSNRILEPLVPERLGEAERVLVIDLHTGHGPEAAVTFLSDASPGSAQDVFFRERVRADRVEATTDNPDATTGTKSGQIANGFRSVLPRAECFASSVEFGTTNDIEQIIATCQEQWVFRRGARAVLDYTDVIWNYRCCFSPDRAEWEQAVMTRGGEHLDRALAAVAAWTS